VREVALLGRSPHLPRFGWESQHDQAIAQKAMEEADIAHLAERPVNAVSGGERQRAFFAMCLAQQPRLLLLDEPVNHLDLGHQIQLLECVRRLNRHSKLTVVGVFHDLNLASEYCDRVLVLRDGAIEASGTPGEVMTPDLIQRVYGAKVAVQTNSVSGRPHVVVAAGSH
jgi:iron complex transport system ATP-binding protein